MNLSFSSGKIAILLTVALCFCAVILMGFSVSNDNRVAYGVMAENSRLAGMSEKEVLDFFEDTGKLKMAHREIKLTYGVQSWSISPEDIHLTANAKEAADAAYAVGRNGSSMLNNFIERLKSAQNGVYIDLDASYDEALLQEKLNAIAAQIYTDPVNAYCILNADGSIQKIAGIVGKKLDTEALEEQLAPSLKKFEFPSLELQPEEQPPFIQTEDIINIDSILASYTTYFSPGDRGDNIAIAAGQLDDALVRSGATLSFNNTVGERTFNAGYKNAGVIIEGRMEDGVGGGVCQVSSTLYNAILLAGLEPTVRASHSYPSSYCPPGRDATVADGLLDFQFRNPLPHSVWLTTSTSGSSLTIYVLGTWADLNGNTITLETEGTRLAPSVYRVYSQNGQVIEREYLHTDDYADPAKMERESSPL